MPKRRTKLGKLKSTVKGPQKKCAAGSQRAVMPPGRPDVRIIICCPPGKWKQPKRGRAKCTVSLRKHAKKKYALKRS